MRLVTLRDTLVQQVVEAAYVTTAVHGSCDCALCVAVDQLIKFDQHQGGGAA